MTIHDLAEYEILDEHRVEDVQSDGFILRHKKSGARIAILSNNDDNKAFYIGFRTPPEDETGVPHIIEHTTLCGSKKFPVKDPFIELAKGSLNTFLNAMTYPDKTAAMIRILRISWMCIWMQCLIRISQSTRRFSSRRAGTTSLQARMMSLR